MRLAPGVVTFLVGLLILAVAGVFYQQSMIASGSFGTGSSSAPQADAKYVCPMLCVEMDKPGDCPKCGMEMTALETVVQPTAPTPGKVEYTCPMHPQIVQDKEGTCPICGMELVPKSNDFSGVDAATQEMVSAVALSPLQAVLSDVQPVHSVSKHMELKVPAIGEVMVPQDRENKLVSWQKGRVDNLLLRETGGVIRSGEHLMDIYSEELIQAQDEYLLAHEAVNRLGDSRFASVAGSSKRLLEASKTKLLRLGMTESQLGELEHGEKVLESIPIYATHGGTVMDKAVTEGMYIKEGTPLFTVADLNQVWVELDVFERDAANLKPGDKVSMFCPIHAGMVFKGEISLVEPTLNSTTRTHRVRVIVDNPDEILRPGMIMDAVLTVDHGELVLLPRNAVLHTGDGDLVYVLIGENQWEPRRVTIGRDYGEQVEIVSGLHADEAVAGTAVFLLDSEAQLKGIPRPLDLEEKDQMEGGSAGHQH